MPGHEEDSSGNGGVWESLTEKAYPIGGTIGAIYGLTLAVGSATDVWGYLLYIGGGFIGGAFIAGLAVSALPWLIGLSAVGLLLKACGF